jgi:glycine dehydrogenase
MPFLNKNRRCTHEFIIDVSGIKESAGIVEEDIAKRLMDYGFHAPTMSWPVHASLMIEPTESENIGELDRFVEAMIAIREEIKKIETGEWDKTDNPLKNAPHTQAMVCASEWNHTYSREVAAFPLSWIRQRGKFWPSVGRVNNQAGDKALILRIPQ